MSDTMSPERRSYVMSRIRGEGTVPETLAHEILLALGPAVERGLTDHPAWPGRPDLGWSGVASRGPVAIFVDGCFWHSCPRCRRSPPMSRRMFWRRKLDYNRRRHRAVTRRLHRLGYRVVRVWEHELRTDDGRVRAARRVLRATGVG